MPWPTHKLALVSVFWVLVLSSYSLLAEDENVVAGLTFYRSTNRAAHSEPVLVLVPGGGGFAGDSWGDIQHLLETHDVAVVDPPGTGSQPKLKKYEFPKIIDAIEAKLLELNRPVILCGHSFGVMYAAFLATQGKLVVRGFVGVAGPLTVEGHHETHALGKHQHSEAMIAAGRAFFEKPSPESWGHWLETLAPLYFSEDKVERGREMLRKIAPNSNHEAFLQLYGPFVRGEYEIKVADKLAAASYSKVLIGGADDKVVYASVLEKEARAANCHFELAQLSGHFVHFDQPHRFGEILNRFFTSPR